VPYAFSLVITWILGQRSGWDFSDPWLKFYGSALLIVAVFPGGCNLNIKCSGVVFTVSHCWPLI
jgi:hypothetical protein